MRENDREEERERERKKKEREEGVKRGKRKKHSFYSKNYTSAEVREILEGRKDVTNKSGLNTKK